MQTIPCIDISGYLIDDRRKTNQIVNELKSAAEEVGFFCIVGHGIEGKTIDDLYAMARVFFECPLPEKQRVAPPTQTFPRGWKGIGFEALAYGNAQETPTDLKEYYHFGKEDWPDTPYYNSPEGQLYFYKNIWPEEPLGFKDAANRYYQKMEGLAEQLCRLSALALDLPENFFDNKIDRHITACRINYYPKQVNPPKAGQLRAGAHTDFGMLTILSGEDQPGGLQVLSREKQWIDVATKPDVFVCNIGDLLMHWTNDRWVSNVHRVLNPPESVARSTSRMSIGFFHHPNYDTQVQCIPSCQSPGLPAKYPPVLSGQFRDYKYEVTRKQAAIA